MPSESVERSILACFPAGDSAEAAAADLKKAGLATVPVDRAYRRSASDAEYGAPLSPAASLGAPAGSSLAGGEAYLLTLVTAAEDLDRAVAIIRERGGRV